MRGINKLSSKPKGNNVGKGERIYCGVGVQLSTNADTKLETIEITKHSLPCFQYK
jgi:hypothetical protein